MCAIWRLNVRSPSQVQIGGGGGGTPARTGWSWSVLTSNWQSGKRVQSFDKVCAIWRLNVRSLSANGTCTAVDGVPPPPSRTGWGPPPPPARTGWGNPPPCKETDEHSEHLLYDGRYASCTHAGGLSCYSLEGRSVPIVVLNLGHGFFLLCLAQEALHQKWSVQKTGLIRRLKLQQSAKIHHPQRRPGTFAFLN